MMYARVRRSKLPLLLCMVAAALAPSVAEAQTPTGACCWIGVPACLPDLDEATCDVIGVYQGDGSVCDACTCVNCPACTHCDNGACVTDCGDGTCDPACEDCNTCPEDCVCQECRKYCREDGVCATTCGDDFCDTECENCGKCAADCPCPECTVCEGETCVTTCGDGTCDPNCEDCATCPEDCGCTVPCLPCNEATGACEPKDCSALDQECKFGRCKESDGACVFGLRPLSTPCGALDLCAPEHCDDSVKECVPLPVVDCSVTLVHPAY